MNAFAEVGIVSAAIFVPVFLAIALTGPKAHLMDPGDKMGSFEPHIKRYLDLARLVLTVAAASIAFLFNLIVTRTTPTSGSICSVCRPVLHSICARPFCSCCFS